MKTSILTLIIGLFSGCTTAANKDLSVDSSLSSNHIETETGSFDFQHKAIHILVALCDNKYQGIVPVPAKIGNGQDANNNLYWGAAYGIKAYFKRSKEWQLVATRQAEAPILERLVFKHKERDFYLVADAYDGQFIKRCTQDFLKGMSGIKKDTINMSGEIIGIGGNANLLSYIGHDGLMDFQLDNIYTPADDKNRDFIILACYSKRYFAPFLDASASPVLWTTGLMAPEGYVIHDALTGYINGENNQQIRERAALAYMKYQKCSLKAARNLLVTGR